MCQSLFHKRWITRGFFALNSEGLLTLLRDQIKSCRVLVHLSFGSEELWSYNLSVMWFTFRRFWTDTPRSILFITCCQVTTSFEWEGVVQLFVPAQSLDNYGEVYSKLIRGSPNPSNLHWKFVLCQPCQFGSCLATGLQGRLVRSALLNLRVGLLVPLKFQGLNKSIP